MGSEQSGRSWAEDILKASKSLPKSSFMDSLLRDALSVLDTARTVDRFTGGASAYTILQTPAGLRMIAGSERPLQALRQEYGAVSGFRVERQGNELSVSADGNDATYSLRDKRGENKPHWMRPVPYAAHWLLSGNGASVSMLTAG